MIFDGTMPRTRTGRPSAGFIAGDETSADLRARHGTRRCRNSNAVASESNATATRRGASAWSEKEVLWTWCPLRRHRWMVKR